MIEMNIKYFLELSLLIFFRGLWNVPFISAAYLVNKTILQNEKTKPSYINNLLDADMAFCLNNRNRGIFMHVSNRVDWGHLVSYTFPRSTNENQYETHNVMKLNGIFHCISVDQL